MKPQIGRLLIKNSIFFQCDIQKRFGNLIWKMPNVIHVGKMMAMVSKVLKIPLIVTEQHSKVFRTTFEEINEINEGNKLCAIFEKRKFSMVTPEVRKHLKKLKNRNQAVLYGIEAHACIQ